MGLSTILFPSLSALQQREGQVRTLLKMQLEGRLGGCINNPFPRLGTDANVKSPEFLKPCPLIIPQYRWEMDKSSPPSSQPTQSLWQARQGQHDFETRLWCHSSWGQDKIFFTSFPTQLSFNTFSSHCMWIHCDFLGHLRALGVLKALLAPPLPLELQENVLLLHHAQEGSRYQH